MARRIVQVVCIAFLVVWGLPKCVMTRIEPYQIGVKRSLTSGVVEKDYAFGYHLAVPGLHTFHRLPATVSYLQFNEDSDIGALEVRTRENNIIFVDVSVVWRIKRGEAWKIVQEGLQDSYPSKVHSTATGVLREGLAALTNTDITMPDKRKEQAEKMLGELNQALQQYHVEALHVVIRGIRFRPEYEQKLQDKQYYIVQGKLDEELKNRSIAVQETETEEKTIEKEIRLKTEEWNAKIEELKTEFEVAIAGIEAEALRYDKKRRFSAARPTRRARRSRRPRGRSPATRRTALASSRSWACTEAPRTTSTRRSCPRPTATSSRAPASCGTRSAIRARSTASGTPRPPCSRPPAPSAS